MRTKSGIEIKEIDITPAMAERWLNEKNTHNRPLYEKTIESYALDMKRGFWGINHQGVAFDEDGDLMDGQQRLSAIVMSGKTVRTLVFYNVPKQFGSNGESHATIETVDGGKPRSMGDRIELSYGINNGNLRSAMVAVLLYLCAGKRIKLSPAIVREIIRVYESEMNAVIENRSVVKGLIYAPVFGSFVFAAKCFKDKVIEFERGYFKGENLSSGSPILTFRNYMLNRQAWSGNASYRCTIQSATLVSLMYYVQDLPLKRIINSNQGLEFFTNKQKRTITEVCELVRL